MQKLRRIAATIRFFTIAIYKVSLYWGLFVFSQLNHTSDNRKSNTQRSYKNYDKRFYVSEKFQSEKGRILQTGTMSGSTMVAQDHKAPPKHFFFNDVLLSRKAILQLRADQT